MKFWIPSLFPFLLALSRKQVVFAQECTNGAYSPYPGDCTQYRQCDNGQWITRQCGSGLYWNQQGLYCDYPDSSGCTQGSSTSTSGKEIVTSSQRGVDCTDQTNSPTAAETSTTTEIPTDTTTTTDHMTTTTTEIPITTISTSTISTPCTTLSPTSQSTTDVSSTTTEIPATITVTQITTSSTSSSTDPSTNTTTTSTTSITSTTQPSSTNATTNSSTSSTSSSTTTPLPPPPSSGIRFAPYIDVTMSTNVYDVYQATGQNQFMLAFALGSSAGCVPTWGGSTPINDSSIINPIQQVQSNGGQFVISTGGAVGPYLENSCSSVSDLANAYMEAMDAVQTTNLDVDIEASIPIDTVNKALAMVQQQRPGTTVSYTLMVQSESYGITQSLGVDVLQNAKQNGVTDISVNPMTMDFPTSTSNYGQAVINAAQSVVKQMQGIWPELGQQELYQMLSVTPMIGVNDNHAVYTEEDAQMLVSWAKQNGVGRLHFWSAGRDNGGCPNGQVSATCSGISQGNYDFINIFQSF